MSNADEPTNADDSDADEAGSDPASDEAPVESTEVPSNPRIINIDPKIRNIMPREMYRDLQAAIGKAAGIDRMFELPKPVVAPPPRVAIPHLDEDFFRDSAPMKTAENTERMADAIDQMYAVTQALVDLTATNVTNTAEQIEDAKTTNKFTRGMAWASLIVAAASLLAGVASLVVSAQPSPTPTVIVTVPPTP